MNITVVGAGIVGCSVAYELASRGARVRLLDSRGVGRGATRASAGILAPHTEGNSPDLLALGVASLELYEAFVRRVAGDSGRSLEFERSGTLQVALDASESAALHDAACALRQRGVQHELLDAAAAARVEPALSARASSGLLIPVHGYVAAAKLAEGLTAAAANRGVNLSSAAVLDVIGRGDGAELLTSSGSIASDAVVIAAGSWTSQIGVRHDGNPLSLENQARAPLVRPIRGQLIHLRGTSRAIDRIVWGTRAYLVPWRDGSVLVGATSEDAGFDERSSAEGVRDLLDAALELVPALASRELAEVRVGLRPRLDDELPAIGWSSRVPSVAYAIGHYRNGVLLAPLTARLVADLLIEGRESPELARVRPSRLGL